MAKTGSLSKKKMRALLRLQKNPAAQRVLKEIDWSTKQLLPFKKNLYKEHRKTAARSPAEVEAFRAQNQIIVQGTAPNPILTFDEVDFLPDVCMEEIRNQECEEPTAIQSYAWPITLSGRNMLVAGKLDAGKPLSIILPAIVHIRAQPPLDNGDGPIALILTPTRESLQRLQTVADAFCASAGVTCAYLFGGVSKDVKVNVEMIIAMPGRVLEFLLDGIIHLNRCTFLVFDEIDIMLYTGLGPLLKKICSQIRPDRQALMWSTMLPKEVDQFAADCLRDYTQIKVGSFDLTVNHIEQKVFILDDREKGPKLLELMKEIKHTREKGAEKIIVFVRSVRRAERVCKFIEHFGDWCQALHRKIPISERKTIVHNFRRNIYNILVTTYASIRYLKTNIQGIGYVINFDFPQRPEEYIHRIRHTGSGDATGVSYTLLIDRDFIYVKRLISTLREMNQDVAPGFLQLAAEDPRGRFKPYSNSGLVIKKGGNLPRKLKGPQRKRLRKEENVVTRRRDRGFTDSDRTLSSHTLDTDSDEDDEDYVPSTNYKSMHYTSKQKWKRDTGAFQNRAFTTGRNPKQKSGLYAGGGSGFGTDEPTNTFTGNRNKNDKNEERRVRDRKYADRGFNSRHGNNNTSRYHRDMPGESSNSRFKDREREQFNENRYGSSQWSGGEYQSYSQRHNQDFRANEHFTNAAQNEYNPSFPVEGNNTESEDLTTKVIELILERGVDSILNEANLLDIPTNFKNEEVDINTSRRYDCPNEGVDYRNDVNYNRSTTRNDSGGWGPFNRRDNLGHNMTHDNGGNRYNMHENNPYDRRRDGDVFSRRNDGANNSRPDRNGGSYHFNRDMNMSRDECRLNPNNYESNRRRNRYN